MSFSAGFRAHLLKSSEDSIITQQSFINDVESFLSNPKNCQSNGNYSFDLSKYSDSSNFVELLNGLKKNFEECGFLLSVSTIPKKGKFVFVYNEYVCQRDYNIVNCNNNLVKSQRLIICL